MSLLKSEIYQRRTTFLHLQMSEFWSGDLGLTLVTIAVITIVFIITPLRETGLRGRIFFDFMMAALMVHGAVNVQRTRAATAVVVAIVLASGVVLGVSRIYPTPSLREIGSVFATITLLIYMRIVLLLMLRAGRVTWSRIQGAVSAYLLLGMAWASVFELLEDLRPGSFHFVTAAADVDQLSAKLLYFSIGNLTGVGSEIVPMLPFARSLTMAEAICGQLFPAILIGALVAMAMQSHQKS